MTDLDVDPDRFRQVFAADVPPELLADGHPVWSGRLLEALDWTTEPGSAGHDR